MCGDLLLVFANWFSNGVLDWLVSFSFVKFIDKVFVFLGLVRSVCFFDSDWSIECVDVC